MPIKLYQTVWEEEEAVLFDSNSTASSSPLQMVDVMSFGPNKNDMTLDRP
jgi:hypothetical protein